MAQPVSKMTVVQTSKELTKLDKYFFIFMGFAVECMLRDI